MVKHQRYNFPTMNDTPSENSEPKLTALENVSGANPEDDAARREAARLMGRSRSAAKGEAARLNGRRGGRPKGQTNDAETKARMKAAQQKRRDEEKDDLSNS